MMLSWTSDMVEALSSDAHRFQQAILQLLFNEMAGDGCLSTVNEGLCQLLTDLSLKLKHPALSLNRSCKIAHGPV